MSIFVSYSRLDEAVVHALARGLEAADRIVWFDNDLSGGEVWWTKILQSIRQADVVMFGLSDHAWGSKPCRSELAYAEALDRHILPIKVGPVSNLRANPLSQLQTLEFRTDDAHTAFEIIGAVDDALRRPRPLPEVMPPEPQMPFAYLISLSEQIDAQELGHMAQVEAVYQLRKAYREETDESVHRDIVGILHSLKSKPWTSRQAEADIDDAFEWIERQEMIKRRLSGAETGEPSPTAPGPETAPVACESAAPLVAAEDARRRRFEQRLADRIGREQEQARARRDEHNRTSATESVARGRESGVKVMSAGTTETRQGTPTPMGKRERSPERGDGAGSRERGTSPPSTDPNGPAQSDDGGGRTFELSNPSLPPRPPPAAGGPDAGPSSGPGAGPAAGWAAWGPAASSPGGPAAGNVGQATRAGTTSPAIGSRWTGVSTARTPPRPISGSPPRPPWGWCIPALLTVVPGIVALYWTMQVNLRLARGDITGARRASDHARGWAIAGIVSFGVVLIVAFLAYA